LRGTWQGSGTWQTSGPDLSGLVGVAALVAVAVAVMMFVLEFIWYIVAFLAAVAVGTVIGAVLLRRKTTRHAAELEATRANRLEAVPSRRQVARANTPQAITNNYGPVFYVTGQDVPAAVARVVIPGQVHPEVRP
jgi:hypothetical protein